MLATTTRPIAGARHTNCAVVHLPQHRAALQVALRDMERAHRAVEKLLQAIGPVWADDRDYRTAVVLQVAHGWLERAEHQLRAVVDQTQEANHV